MRVLFWGTPEFALAPLRALTEEGHEVVGVVTQPDRPAGRGREVSPPPVKRAALVDGIPVLQPERPTGEEFLQSLRDLRPEVSVVVAYGRILSRQVLDLPELGSLNIHASLLPKLRGAAPVHWAIIRGHEVTGVSIMRMVEELDAGPVLFQVTEPIRADESTSELTSRLSELGAEALVDALAMLAMDVAEAVPQDDSQSTYAPKVDRETARIDWSLPAEEVSRWIRGLDASPGAWSELDGSSIKLFSPVVAEGRGDPGLVLDADGEAGILVAAGNRAVRIDEVQPSGKTRMPAGAWVRGRGIAAGQRLV